MKNDEMTTLKKIALTISILAVLISPWLYHDRAITKMQTDITYIKEHIMVIESHLALRTAKKTICQTQKQ